MDKEIDTRFHGCFVTKDYNGGKITYMPLGKVLERIIDIYSENCSVSSISERNAGNERVVAITFKEG